MIQVFLMILFIFLIMCLKESIDPEAEYDEKFLKSSETANCVVQRQGINKYSKVVARKR